MKVERPISLSTDQPDQVRTRRRLPDDVPLDGVAAVRREPGYAVRLWAISAPAPFTICTTPTAALAGVQRLRELHAAMAAAVLTAYGWADLLPKCASEFLLGYDEEDSETVGLGDGEIGPESQSLPVLNSQSRRKSPGATAGPTNSATKSSPASCNSTPSARRMSGSPGRC